jgi:ABC-type multidrug transport system fused ATPase/permease subunit
MRDTYRKLFDLLTRQERRRFFLLLAMIIVMALVDMAGVASILPFLAVVSDPEMVHKNAYLAAAYDWLGMTSDQKFLIFLGFGVFGMLIITMLVKLVTLYALARFAQMRTYTISSRLVEGYLRQPYSWFLNRHSAQLSRSVLSEVHSVVSASLIPAMRIIAQSISLLALAVLLFLVNPAVAASAIVMFVGAYLGIFLTVRRRLSKIGAIRLKAARERFGLTHELFGVVKEVKLLGLEASYIARLRKPMLRTAEAASQVQLIGDMPRLLLETVAFGGILLLILVMLLTGDGNITSILPTLGVFAFAGLRMFPSIQNIYQALTGMRSSSATLNSLHAEYVEVVKQPALPLPMVNAGRLHLRERLELRNVRYSYPVAERAAVNGLSMTIAANTTVGIVGGTGAGKTTAVDVMLGLLRPQSGEIAVDGTVLGPDNLRLWQNVLGYVPQQISLIDDSVSANIAFGVPPGARDHAAIERAARIANLHDFIISDLPDGYATKVGERGVRLSGGQRQRIGIARALYHDPDVLILDEATSALDNLTERAVMDAVHALGHRKTIIMIAHRLTTVRNCDLIFLLEQGRVVASGTYDELVAGNDTFRRMVNS